MMKMSNTTSLSLPAEKENTQFCSVEVSYGSRHSTGFTNPVLEGQSLAQFGDFPAQRQLFQFSSD